MENKTTKKSVKRSFKPVGKTIYIGNLRYTIDEKELYHIFGKFGQVKKVNLLRETGSEQSKGIAFVEMLKATDAENAIKALDGKIVAGRTVKVSIATENKIFSKKKVSPEKEEAKPNKFISKKKAEKRGGLNELKRNMAKKVKKS